MSLKIKISEFPDYEKFPSKGVSYYTDSKVFELEFETDSIEYLAKFHLSINYNRWYSPQTQDSPEEDDSDLMAFEVEVFKIYKYVDGDEIELKDKEFRKIENFIIENLELC